MSNTYKQLPGDAKPSVHNAVNFRDINSKLIVAHPGDWLTYDADGNILSVSKTDPTPKPVDSEPAKEPEATVELQSAS